MDIPQLPGGARAGKGGCPALQRRHFALLKLPLAEPKPAGQQLKELLLQQRPGSGDCSPKQIGTFTIKIDKKAIKGINCPSLA